MVFEDDNVRVATVHAAAPFLDLARGIECTVDFIHQAAKGGARLVAFPETFLPGFPIWLFTNPLQDSARFFSRLFNNSIEFPSAEANIIAEATREAGIWACVGVNERDGGTLYNTQAWFSPQGELVAKHRKLQPTGIERTVWGRGDGRDVFVIDAGFAKLGGLVCFEHSIDLSRYALAALGEQIHVASWPPYKAPHGNLYSKVLSTAHAICAQTFVIVSNGRVSREVLEELGIEDSPEIQPEGGGLSGFIRPDGEWIGEPHTDDEAVLFADFDMGEIAKAKFLADASGHYARPDIFRFDVNREPVEPLPEESMRRGVIHHLPETSQKLGTV